MDSIIEKRFKEMGAEVLIEQRGRSPRFAIDIEEEIFLISGSDIKKEDIRVLDIQPDMKHLLLMWRENRLGQPDVNHKFLCGHDERQWFVAAVPPDGVRNVSDAMEALKPEIVRDRERKLRVSGEGRKSRHNDARKRQGEWFFVPTWNQITPKNLRILRNEPIVRGRGKPHMCEFLHRIGGEKVWVCSKYPNGVTEGEYRAIIKKKPEMKKHPWRTMVRDARVFAKGKISHPDHATLDLGSTWHEVFPNRENEAPSMRHMRFLD